MRGRRRRRGAAIITAAAAMKERRTEVTRCQQWALLRGNGAEWRAGVGLVCVWRLGIVEPCALLACSLRFALRLCCLSSQSVRISTFKASKSKKSEGRPRGREGETLAAGAASASFLPTLFPPSLHWCCSSISSSISSSMMKMMARPLRLSFSCEPKRNGRK